MNSRFLLGLVSLSVVLGCGGQVDTQVRDGGTVDSGSADQDAQSACVITLGSPCVASSSAPNCCAGNAECGPQPPWLTSESTCCQSLVGSRCTRKAECCGDLECVRGSCINPTPNNSCDPVALTGNGCPNDAELCLVIANMPIPSCIAAAARVPVGSSCMAGNVCERGSYCSAQESLCRRYCYNSNPQCVAPLRCSRIGTSAFGACVP